MAVRRWRATPGTGPRSCSRWRRARGFAELLSCTVGPDLSGVQVLDVGCGTGGFLRQMIDWGASPANLTGTELQTDRLDHARRCTAHGVRWHLGTLDAVSPASYDLVTALTVFSSVLDPALRRELATQMWRALRPGGWCLVFDFRYDNPRNRNVRKVTRSDCKNGGRGAGSATAAWCWRRQSTACWPWRRTWCPNC